MGLEEMGRFGEVDQVTWLHNRRHFMEALHREVARAKRYRRSLSLIFLDIDHFSAFNESYGPTLGDRLLRSVGMLLAEMVTEPEVVARFGADEFGLILPEVNRAAAVSVTTSLMARLGQVTVFSGSGSPEPVTASAAIVCYPEDGATARELVATAATGLEEAKREKLATAPNSEPVEATS
jgi:diguanylate cyclase (GGDEF)-like protein